MQSLIRNFSIIAHIDHGKSTLADRFLEATGAVTAREFKEQILDAMASKDPEAETIQGSLVAVRGTTIDPLLAEENYFVGSMSPLRMLRWWLSRHVLAMFVLIAGGILMLGGLAYLTLRAKARKRLNA